MLAIFRRLLAEPNNRLEAELDGTFQANPKQFCLDALPILTELPASDNLLQLIVVYLNKRLTSLTKHCFQQHRGWLLQLCESLTTNEGIPNAAKKLWREWLTALFDELQLEANEVSFCDSQQFAWLVRLLRDVISNSNQELAVMAVTVVEAVQEVDYGDACKYVFFKQTLPGWVQLGDRIFEGAKQRQEELQELQNEPTTSLERLNQTCRAIVRQINRMKEWLQCTTTIIQLFVEVAQLHSNLAASIFLELADNGPLCSVFRKVLGLTFETKTHRQGSIFSTSGLQPGVDYIVNEAKACTLKALTKIIGEVRRISTEATPFEDRTAYKEVEKLTPALFESLLTFATIDPTQTTSDKNAVRHTIDEYCLEAVVRQTFKFLAVTIKLSFCQVFVSRFFHQLFEQVLLPLLSDDVDVMDELQKNPDGHYQYCSDLSQLREYDSEENHAVNLIETVSKRIDGALPWIVGACVQPLLQSSNVNKQSRLKVLVCVSYLICQRVDLLQQLHGLMLRMDVIGQFTSNELLWYYVLLEFLLQELSVLAPEEYTSVVMGALETPESDPTFPYVQDLLAAVLRLAPNNQLYLKAFSKAPTSRSVKYFQFLQGTLGDNLQVEVVSESAIVTLAGCLVKRLAEEAANLPSSEQWTSAVEQDRRDHQKMRRKNNILLYKILNVLIELSGSTELLRRYPSVVREIRPVLEHLRTDSIDFDEEITRIFLHILVAVDHFDADLFCYLSRLPAIFQKQGQYKYLYEIAAQFLVRGIDGIKTNSGCLNILLDLIEAGWATANEEVISQAAVLYQLFLRTVASEVDGVHKVDWEYPYRITRQLFEVGQTKQFKPQTLCRLVNCWLWALPYLGQIDCGFMGSCYQSSLCSNNTYNCRVFICGLERAISGRLITDPSTIASFIASAVTVLEQTLKTQESSNDKVRRGKQPNSQARQYNLGNPDSNTDMFRDFRNILLVLQSTHAAEHTEILRECSAQGITVQRMKLVSGCLIENNQPRRYLKVDRSKYSHGDKLEEC